MGVWFRVWLRSHPYNPLDKIGGVQWFKSAHAHWFHGRIGKALGCRPRDWEFESLWSLEPVVQPGQNSRLLQDDAVRVMAES